MAQECATCGQFYGLTHTCPGAIVSTTLPPAREWIQPRGFSPIHYIEMAIGVARFDDAAIQAASKDELAFAYGAAIWLAAKLLIYGLMMAPLFRANVLGSEIAWIMRVGTSVLIACLVDAIIFLTQFGLAHSLARWWFGAKGTYVQILRAMLMGSIVMLIAPIPFLGSLFAGVWMLAILMRVFEEVDGVERMKAFGLSFGIGLTFWLLVLFIRSVLRYGI